MENEIFELAGDTEELVALKVKELDNLKIALNPYVNATFDYITITKGDNHTLTITYKDGHTWSYHWGLNGHTLVGTNEETLKRKSVEFIQSCGIDIGNYAFY